VAQFSHPQIHLTSKDWRWFVLPYHGLQIVAAFADVLALLVSSCLGFSSYQYASTGELKWQPESLGLGVLASIFFVLLSRTDECYKLHAILNPRSKIIRAWLLLSLTFLFIVNTLYLLKVGEEYSRGGVIIFLAIAFALVTLVRDVLSKASAEGIQRGVIAGKKVVTIGVQSELDQLARSDFRQFGMEEIGRVAVAQGGAGLGLGEKGAAQISNAIALARELRADEFVLLLPWNQERLLAEVGQVLRTSALGAKLFPDHNIRNILNRQPKSPVYPALAAEVQRQPLSVRERATKRVLDLLLALCAITVLAPLLLIVAVAIKLDSGGPVLFRQRRCGFDNREFVIFKFRTMTTLDDGAEIVQARRADKRVTRIGRLLRRSSIDELPQLFNVILGHMSLVGPRPHAVAHNEHYNGLVASYAFRHHVKPGLTGMAQVRGLRGETSQLFQMEQRVENDLWYINHWSLTLDLTIMARTCLELLRHDIY
jgi:putative colanic acid biosynthesis UDP-glucose lipid carrier transferase